jgi:hypothetical protein
MKLGFLLLGFLAGEDPLKTLVPTGPFDCMLLVSKPTFPAPVLPLHS